VDSETIRGFALLRLNPLFCEAPSWKKIFWRTRSGFTGRESCKNAYRRSYAFLGKFRNMDVCRNFPCEGRQRRHFAYPFRIADGAMQLDVHKTLYPFFTKRNALC